MDFSRFDKVRLPFIERDIILKDFTKISESKARHRNY